MLEDVSKEMCQNFKVCVCEQRWGTSTFVVMWTNQNSVLYLLGNLISAPKASYLNWKENVFRPTSCKPPLVLLHISRLCFTASYANEPFNPESLSSSLFCQALLVPTYIIRTTYYVHGSESMFG